MHTFEKFCSACGVNICSVSLDRETTFLTLKPTPPPPHFFRKISSDLHRSHGVSDRRLGGKLPRLPPPPRGDATVSPPPKFGL